jgi:4-aminobutyrate aminotransferase-like enzyme
MAPSETLVSSPTQRHEPAAKKVKTSNSASDATPKISSSETMELENVYSAHNYHPLPVVFSKGLGAKVWDPEGREYLDFLSACILHPNPSLTNP